NGPEFIMAFLKYQAELLTESVAGHKGFPGYHFVVALFGIFPASIFALGALRKKQADESVDIYHFRLLMIIVVAVVLVLFSVVQSKIVHYSSMVYYPVSFLSAWTVCRFLDGQQTWKTWQATIGVFVAVVFLIVMIALPTIGMHIDWLKTSFTFDAFTRASLDAEVMWSVIDYFPATWIVLILGTFTFLWRQGKHDYSLLTLFTGMGLFVSIALIFFIGKIARYSQDAASEFCEKYEGQQVEIQTIGYKSYLQFFYAQKPAPDTSRSTADIPHYYIMKVDKRKKLEERPELQIMYEKNGFIFLEQK
ncbi:MAG TPA: hypothetical protein VLA46_12740, partial [Saprospiraceae bacterium]|nr:hypothetical protein [Saprospiraceae bacterium]